MSVDSYSQQLWRLRALLLCPFIQSDCPLVCSEIGKVITMDCLLEEMRIARISYSDIMKTQHAKRDEEYIESLQRLESLLRLPKERLSQEDLVMSVMNDRLEEIFDNKKPTPIAAKQERVFHLSCSSDSLGKEGLTGLIFYTYNKQKEWRINNYHMKSGYIVLKNPKKKLMYLGMIGFGE